MGKEAHLLVALWNLINGGFGEVTSFVLAHVLESLFLEVALELRRDTEAV